MKLKYADRYISELGSHMPVLDGIRGWAVIFVIACHATTYVVSGNFFGTIGETIIKIMSYGWVGVDLFFVLSGFLITGILIETKDTPKYFRNFFAKRILRIFPLYYLVLMLFLFLTPFLINYFNKDFSGEINLYKPFFFLYLQNFIMSPDENSVLYQIMRPTWSLAVEEHFYLLWPAVVYYVKDTKLLKISIVLILTAIITRVMVIAGTHFSLQILRYWATTWTFCRMDSILAGALLAVLVRSPSKRELLDKLKWKLTAVIIALVAVFMNLKYVSVINFTLYAFLFASIINVVLFSPKIGFLVKLFDNSMFRGFGKYSYCMYLFHIPIMLIISNNFKSITHQGLVGVFLLFVISTASTWMFAWLSWHAYEKHFLSMKKYFESAKSIDQYQENIAPISLEILCTVGNEADQP